MNTPIASQPQSAIRLEPEFLELLRCPVTTEPLFQVGRTLVSESRRNRYTVTETGIPVMADEFCSEEGRTQRAHYDTIASAYIANLKYPHTEEYMRYIDGAVLKVAEGGALERVAEICCGRAGETFRLLGNRVRLGVGLDISLDMLEAARAELPADRFMFVQGDATSIPLRSAAFDSVFMLGAIHHVNERQRLFAEVFRILKPGGRFVWREPANDFFLWRLLRNLIYRVSPLLDPDTERPLRWQETWPVLKNVGFEPQTSRTLGFFGGCLLLNSDVLVVNRLFRFIPGIRTLTRIATRIDELFVRFPGMSRAGLQVVGVAVKP